LAALFRGGVAPGSAAALLLAATLAGCTSSSFIPTSGHIDTTVKAEPDKEIPATVRVTPPTAARRRQRRKPRVVCEPSRNCCSRCRDTRQNIDIHPTLTGLGSLNAINETLPAILERVSKQVNMRYRTEGNTIIVSPDTPYVKTYRVNYVNMTRDTTSSIGVSGELTVTGSATGGGSGGSGGGASGGAGGASSSGSNTVVRTTSKNDFWDQLRENIRSILNSTRLQSMTADARAERLALVKQEQELRVKQLEAASRAGQAAPALATLPVRRAHRRAAAIAAAADDVVVNAASGTITVNATDQRHQLVQRHIDSITSAMCSARS
jgi:general secretion pathway protein D